MKFFLYFLLVCYLPSSLAADQLCEKVWSGGASVIIYCPKKYTNEKLAVKAIQYSNQYFNHQMNQVHLFFFNDRKLMPSSTQKFLSIPDKVFGRIQTAIYNKNLNTRHESFQCAEKGNLIDCTHLLKK